MNLLDVIGPVMIGPSSSHTAGAVRLGLLAVSILGESPIKADGKLMVIDGGMSKAYQKTTGIAGYSLLNDSYGFKIVTHAPFTSIEEILAKGRGNETLANFLAEKPQRRLIKDTPIGDQLRSSIADLNQLMDYMP